MSMSKDLSPKVALSREVIERQAGPSRDSWTTFST